MLKYLFTVLYKDGSRYEQNPEDISVKDPSKSCFFDVDIPNVKIFTLTGPDHSCYAVDLDTGSFQLNSPNWITCHDADADLPDKQLVYFRRVTKDFNAANDQINEKIVYYLGWKIKKDGREVPYAIAIE